MVRSGSASGGGVTYDKTGSDYGWDGFCSVCRGFQFAVDEKETHCGINSHHIKQ
jgi:hypothetical protein